MATKHDSTNQPAAFYDPGPRVCSCGKHVSVQPNSIHAQIGTLKRGVISKLYPRGSKEYEMVADYERVHGIIPPMSFEYMHGKPRYDFMKDRWSSEIVVIDRCGMDEPTTEQSLRAIMAADQYKTRGTSDGKD